MYAQEVSLSLSQAKHKRCLFTQGSLAFMKRPFYSELRRCTRREAFCLIYMSTDHILEHMHIQYQQLRIVLLCVTREPFLVKH